MPWYYAGPDAKPVGPIELNELQARRASGVISPDTYIIEYIGAPNDARAWRRYKELFPLPPSLPPPTPPPILPPAIPAYPVPQAHPLFPSATSQVAQANPNIPPTQRSNPWCSWGFGLGLGSLILLLPSCGLTVFMAIPAFIISLIGLFQVQHDPKQTGRNLAFSGLFLSGAALLITVVVLAVALPAILKGRGLITTTEQSSSDSE